MSSLASTLDKPYEAAVSAGDAPPSFPTWKILLLVAINFLSVPLAIPILYFPRSFTQATWTDLWFLIVGLYHGQLFLLAYWMSFGGAPKVRRRILLSLLAICGAATVAAMHAHRAFLFFGGNRPVQLSDFQPVVISLFVVWALHAIFLVATCCSPIVINFPESTGNTRHTLGHFTFVDALALIGVALIPSGLLLLLFWMDHTFASKMLAQVAVSALFTSLALTPAALLLVTETHLVAKLVGVSIWAAFVTILFLMIPHHWAPVDTNTTHVAACGIVFFNLLILRWMGLRWRGNREPQPTSPATS